MFLMKLYISIFFIFISTSISYAGPDGKGDLQLSENVVNSFINYITGNTSRGKAGANKPMAFWVSSDGSHSLWYYCPFDRCAPPNSTMDRKQCEKGTTLECSRFAKGRYVRWENGINPKGKRAKFSSKMKDNEIRSKLTSLGFYNNNKSSNKENNSNNNLIEDENENLTLDQQLENLSKLFDKGLLTEEEFQAAKNKLLQ